jgi:3'-5' exoribonuclease
MPAMNSPRRYINQLKAGETLDQAFLVREKELRTAKNGSQYIQCTLCDKTGTLAARMWQASEAIFNAIPAEGFLHVKGRCEDYRGSLQVIIDACRPYPSDKVDIADFLPVTELDVEQMWAELLEILRAVKDKHLRLLIKKFVEDRELVAGFKKAPAAMQMHHPFVGGLLEHTLKVARAAKALLPLYPKLNADLVLAGAFVHDVGKIAELSAGVTMSYTDRGLLIGHITIGVLWVQQKAAALAAETSEPFPQRTLDLLQHIILAHHGVHEYGSPKLPAIPEAFFIHFLDNLDAKMFMTLNAIASDPDRESSFTGYLKQIETKIYKHSGELP